MSKWALFTAHRYLERDAPARAVGADGRPRCRPWRSRAPAAVAEARRRRAGRRQSPWSRLVGCALLGVAGMAALHPVGSVPSHVAASASARPGSRLQHLQAIAPRGDLAAAPPAFRFRRDRLAGPVAFVLQDAAYRELTRRDGMGGDELVADDELAGVLAAGGTFHWFVESRVAGALVRSRLETFAIR